MVRLAKVLICWSSFRICLLSKAFSISVAFLALRVAWRLAIAVRWMTFCMVAAVVRRWE